MAINLPFQPPQINPRAVSNRINLGLLENARSRGFSELDLYNRFGESYVPRQLPSNINQSYLGQLSSDYASTLGQLQSLVDQKEQNAYNELYGKLVENPFENYAKKTNLGRFTEEEKKTYDQLFNKLKDTKSQFNNAAFEIYGKDWKTIAPAELGDSANLIISDFRTVDPSRAMGGFREKAIQDFQKTPEFAEYRLMNIISPIQGRSETLTTNDVVGKSKEELWALKSTNPEQYYRDLTKIYATSASRTGMGAVGNEQYYKPTSSDLKQFERYQNYFQKVAPEAAKYISPDEIGSIYQSTAGAYAGQMQDYIKDVNKKSDIDKAFGAILDVAFPAIGYALGGPIGAAALSGGSKLAQGADFKDALRAAALSYGGAQLGQSLFGGMPVGETGAFDIAGNPDILGGSSAVSLGNVAPSIGTGAFDQGIGLEVMSPQPGFVSSTDYSLLGGSNIPGQSPTMGLGQGITSTPAALPPAEMIGVTPIDYGSLLAPAQIPGVIGGIGLQAPTMPNIGSMGGGQGLTVPVQGGTVGQLGFTPTGAVPVLGSPSSFINNPEVLGKPVLAQGTPAAGLSVSDALRGANTLRQLTQGQPQAVPQQGGQQAGMQPTGVDYNQLFNLLASRASTAGLLGTRFQPINLTSLLG